MNNAHDFILSFEHETDAVIFRLNGVLIERLSTYALYGDVQLAVLRAVRRYHPALSDFVVADTLWRKMVNGDKPEQVYTFTDFKGVRLACCKDYEGSYSVRVYRGGLEDFQKRHSTAYFTAARVIFERLQEELA